jgi:hypothetical protein
MYQDNTIYFDDAEMLITFIRGRDQFWRLPTMMARFPGLSTPLMARSMSISPFSTLPPILFVYLALVLTSISIRSSPCVQKRMIEN